MTTLLRAVIDATGLSRRKAFDAIRAGRLTTGDRALTDPSAEYDGGPLSLDGHPVRVSAPARVYLLLNKPPGYVTTAADERGRPTVFDLVPASLRVPGLHAVGRLDLDTSGLLLLTNDGALTHHLTHPATRWTRSTGWGSTATPRISFLPPSGRVSKSMAPCAGR